MYVNLVGINTLQQNFSSLTRVTTVVASKRAPSQEAASASLLRARPVAEPPGEVPAYQSRADAQPPAERGRKSSQKRPLLYISVINKSGILN